MRLVRSKYGSMLCVSLPFVRCLPPPGEIVPGVFPTPLLLHLRHLYRAGLPTEVNCKRRVVRTVKGHSVDSRPESVHVGS